MNIPSFPSDNFIVGLVSFEMDILNDNFKFDTTTNLGMGRVEIAFEDAFSMVKFSSVYFRQAGCPSSHPFQKTQTDLSILCYSSCEEGFFSNIYGAPPSC